MKLQCFEVPGLAHYSYIISAAGQAVVVDPKRDIDTYLNYATENGLKITHILETHIHADYVSGALELAAVTGAELWLSGHDTGETFQYQFPHHEFHDQEVFRTGDVRITALHTPGHTPEHLSFLVTDLSRCEEPVALLSGDLVFVGSLGRPDLLGEDAKLELANQLYSSIHARIKALPDGLEVLPAHGAGSLCGSGMSERPQSTLGYERLCNVFFKEKEKRNFVEHILSTVPPFPEYYKRMKKINSAGPKILRTVPGGDALPVKVFYGLYAAGNHIIIDLRRPEAFGGAHIPGSFNIGAGQNLSMWAGWVVPYDQPILLVGDDSTNYEEARRSLIRVGFDDLRGHLKGGIKNWLDAGFAQAHIPQISVEDLERKLHQNAFVLDVRSKGEWESGHIMQAKHISGGDLVTNEGFLSKNQTIHVICGTGYRSSIAASVLRRLGFKDVVDVSGGMGAWQQREFPVTCESIEPIRAAS